LFNSVQKINASIQALLNPDAEKEIPIKPLLILVAAAITFIFIVLFLVSHKSDQIAQRQQTVLFENFLTSHIDATQETVDHLISLPGTMEALHDSLSPKELNSKITIRLADRLSTTDVFVTDGKGNVLLGDSSYTSIYPLDLKVLKPKIKSLIEQIEFSQSQNFSSDRIILNDLIYQVSLRRTQSNNQVRYLTVATPLANIFENRQRLPMKITITNGATSPKQSTHLFVLNIQDSTEETLGWISWQRNLPGHVAILHYLPIILSIALIMCCAAFFLWRQANNLSRNIIQSHEEASKRALHDPLTGLANRTLLKQQIEAAKSQVKRGKDGFALHLIDLDKFKVVNDSLGHPAGDELIRQAATRLKEACRASDTVARIGGDEFAVIQIEAQTTSTISRLARRINEQMSRAFSLNGNEVFVSASVGIAVDTNGHSNQEELMRRADIALYRAKEAGRNQYCFFEEEMDEELKRKHAIERDLRQALQKPAENGLRVVYQPQVSANGRHVRGMEALIRWSHPERGNVSPADFIPVAEETNLVVALDEFVMTEAFKTAVKWPEITMAVNVSAKELHLENYPSKVIALANDYHVRPDQIELEITESVLLEDSPQIARTLKVLKAAGFKIALDDFGTGYSSLSYLRRHQVDKLKIDQSFVASIGVRDDASAVVQAILSLGESLGLSVTAEGVETPAQRDSLRAQGCAYLQGYLFSRPLEKDDIASLLHKFKERNAQQRLKKIS